MDPIALEAIKSAALLILGFVWQHTRANPRFPNVFGYAVFGIACIGAWMWATPAWNAGDWRLTLLGLFNFYMGARGAAASSKDAGLTPPASR